MFTLCLYKRLGGGLQSVMQTEHKEGRKNKKETKKKQEYVSK